MKPVAVIKYSEFYGTSLPADTFSLLRPYPTDLIILRLSKINALHFLEPHDLVEFHRQVFVQCFPGLTTDRRMRVEQELAGKSHERDITYFTAQSILRLISSAFENYPPVPEEDEPANLGQFENDLFDSLLIQNDIYYSSLSDEEELNSFAAIWQLQLMQQGYVRSYHSLLNTTPILHFLFHKFLVKTLPNGEKLIAEFDHNLALKGFFNYYILFRDILQKVFEAYQENKQAKHILSLEDSQRKIVDLLSFKPSDFLGHSYTYTAHKDFIPKPIYYALGQHPIILDFHFFLHIVNLALAFNFYNYTSLKASQTFPSFSRFKAFLGRQFYEGFIVQQIFERIFRKKNFSLLFGSDNSLLPDVTIVRNQREILMVEVKSSEVHYNVLEEKSGKKFGDFLDEKFCAKKDGKGTKNKGVYQLATQLAHFAETTRLDEILKDPSQKKKAVIFPVIIYTDSTLDMAGVNRYLDEKFQDAAVSSRDYFRKVYPLVTINMDFFLDNFLDLLNHPTMLTDLIKDYHRTVARTQKLFQQAPHPMNYFEQGLSFTEFVSKKIKKGNTGDNFRSIVKELELLNTQ